jgi:hypothetical protein
MAVVSWCDDRDDAGEAHGKEGVNGSNLMEGFALASLSQKRSWSTVRVTD